MYLIRLNQSYPKKKSTNTNILQRQIDKQINIKIDNVYSDQIDRQIPRQTKKYVQIETRQVPNNYLYLEDEYAGLMSARDKQFITNIQLNQEYFYNQDFNLRRESLKLK